MIIFVIVLFAGTPYPLLIANPSDEVPELDFPTQSLTWLLNKIWTRTSLQIDSSCISLLLYIAAILWTSAIEKSSKALQNVRGTYRFANKRTSIANYIETVKLNSLQRLFCTTIS